MAEKPTSSRIVLYDTSSRSLRVLQRCLQALGYDVVPTADAQRLKLEMRAQEPDLLVVSADAHGGSATDDLLAQYFETREPIPVVLYSATRSRDALKASAPIELLVAGVLSAPIDPGELARLVFGIVPPADLARATKAMQDLVADLDPDKGGARLLPPDGKMPLEDNPLFGLLWAIDFTDWSGSLTLTDAPRGGVRLYFEFGQLTYAHTREGKDIVAAAIRQGRIKSVQIPDVPLKNDEEEVGLLMALRAIGMHEVDKLREDAITDLLDTALGITTGWALAEEDAEAPIEWGDPKALGPLMLDYLQRRGAAGETVLDVHPASSIIVRLPSKQVSDGWGLRRADRRLLELLHNARDREISLDQFLRVASEKNPAARTSARSVLALLASGGFVAFQGRPWPAEVDEKIEELVRELHKVVGGGHFRALGLDRDASDKQVKEAARALLRKYHPDSWYDQHPRVQEAAEALFNRVQEAYDVLKTPESREAYRRTLTKGGADLRTDAGASDPALAKVALHKGKGLLRHKRYPEALDRFRDATLHDGQNVEARILLGWARYLAGQGAAAATEDLEAALRIEPKAAEAWYYLGRLAVLSNDPDRARKRFAKAISLRPGFTEAERELRLIDKRGSEGDKGKATTSGRWNILGRLRGKDGG